MKDCQLDFIDVLERPVPRVRAAAAELPDLEETARALLRGIGCAELAKTVRVRWHSRLRTTAGQALYAKFLVRMNPKLVQFGAVEIDRTLRHELAHLVARFRTGRRRIEPHGPEWRRACRDLGIADEKRCHDLQLPRSRQRVRHKYRCPHCKLEYGRVRPFRRAVACIECCRAHSRGMYDERFRLVKVREPISVDTP
ncbi:MAG: SprT-like domain-containing protein [Chthoniobacteraceae bacterium]